MNECLVTFCFEAPRIRSLYYYYYYYYFIIINGILSSTSVEEAGQNRWLKQT